MKRLYLILTLLLAGTMLFAQRAGDLNTDFGQDGILMERWEDAYPLIYNTALLSDGNIIAAGRIYELGADTIQKIFVHKVDEKGNLLPFGNTTRGFVYPLEDWSTLSDVYARTDNTLLIMGYYKKEGKSLPYIMKLLPDGQLDKTFGMNGIAKEDTIPTFFNDAMVFQKNGPSIILLSGYSIDKNLPMLLAIDDYGDLLPAFGTDGICRLSDRPCIITCLDMDTASNYLYAFGYFLQGDTIMVAKISLPDGQLCSDFGEDGVYYYSTGQPVNSGEVIFENDSNTLALFGKYKHGDGDWDIFACRINAEDANPDTSFGIGGRSALRIAGSNENDCIAVKQSDGKYCIGAGTDYHGTADFLMSRMNHDGSMDTAFGTDGLVITELENQEYFSGCLLSPEENIIYAAGNYSIGDTLGAIMVAYHTGYKIELPVPTFEQHIKSTLLYPNPVTGNVTIATGIAGQHRVQVLDMTGKVSRAGVFYDENICLNLEGLKPSVYFIKIFLPDSQVKTFKIVKQ